LVGGPPCFIADTKVLTNNGYKNIQDVNLNNTLITHTGTYQKIINLQQKEYNDILYEIKAKYHPFYTICTKEHPFYVRKQNKIWNNNKRNYDYTYDTPEWINAENLSYNYFVGMPISQKNIVPEFTSEKKINQKTIIEEKKILDNVDYWFLMGYFLGDGWTVNLKETNGQSIKRSYLVINNKQIDKLLPRFEKVIKLTKCNNCMNRTKYECDNLLWYNILKQFGQKADKKIIPEWVINSPLNFIQAFLDGYISADGCNYKNKIKITTVSYNIAYSIQRIYLKLGKFCSIKYQQRPEKFMINGRIVNKTNSYQMEILINPLKRKQKSFIEDNYAWFEIYDIKQKNNVTPTKVYNFEVDVDNSYCVDNIIVHNCQGFSIAGKRDNKDPRNSLFMEYVKYLNYFKPKAFIMENVIGILSMKTAGGELVKDIILEELKVNYDCNFFKLSAADFEVPQKRKRVIFIGFRKDLKIVPTEPSKINPDNHIAVKTILENKKDIDKKYYLSEKALEGIRKKKEKMKIKGHGFGAQILDLNEPSFTIPARYWKDGYDALVKYSDTKVRRLTIKELSKIQTFPDNYDFKGSSKEIIMQIGNAVACKFAYHLGNYIKNILININPDSDSDYEEEKPKKNLRKVVKKIKDYCSDSDSEEEKPKKNLKKVVKKIKDDCSDSDYEEEKPKKSLRKVIKKIKDDCSDSDYEEEKPKKNLKKVVKKIKDDCSDSDYEEEKPKKNLKKVVKKIKDDCSDSDSEEEKPKKNLKKVVKNKITKTVKKNK
jgi:DNA-cytosine methyltransferase